MKTPNSADRRQRAGIKHRSSVNPTSAGPAAWEGILLLQSIGYDLAGLCAAARALSAEIADVTDDTGKFGTKLSDRTQALRNILERIEADSLELAGNIDPFNILRATKADSP